MEWFKRNFLPLSLAIVIILGLSLTILTFYDNGLETTEGVVVGNSSYSSESKLETLHNNVVSGGPPPDGIPPIENPQYTSIQNMEMDDDHQVFVYETNNQTYIYPQRILVWHEIVNDEFSDEKVSITYCPLTGSAVAFEGTLDTINTTYGTSGDLVNSNLIMYDRSTNSRIPQILGEGIQGDLKGKRLSLDPLIWTEWGLAKREYDEARVLTENTGFSRDYNEDSYGSYLESGTYYQEGGFIFPLVHENNEYGLKQVFIGVRSDEPVAISKAFMREQHVLNFKAGNTSLVAFYDEDLDNVFVYERRFQRDILEFENTDNGFVDQQGRVWNSRGESSLGELRWEDSFDVFWGAWYGFYPETKVFA